jgi:hypothetical protein
VPVVGLGGGPGPGLGVCSFWYNAPGSTPTNKKVEVAYRAGGDADVHAVPVTFSANAEPTFGTDHLVAHFGGSISFTFGIAANHFMARINTGGYDCPHMATIPATGNATDADLWVPTKQQVAGCMCTISHDGAIGGYNSGYAQWCPCLADQTCNLRHRSLTLVPFQEKTATPIEWVKGLVETKATSINWAPKQYLNFLPNDTVNGIALFSDYGADFGYWNYTNNNEYIVGSLGLANYNINPDSLNKAIRKVTPDTGAIWLIHYPTNTWTRILRPLAPITHSTLLGASAVWIDTIPVGTITPLHGNRLQYRGVPLENAGNYYDIRGRRISLNAMTTQKLYSGVYYIVAPNGVIKRMIVGR